MYSPQPTGMPLTIVGGRMTRLWGVITLVWFSLPKGAQLARVSGLRSLYKLPCEGRLQKGDSSYTEVVAVGRVSMALWWYLSAEGSLSFAELFAISPLETSVERSTGLCLIDSLELLMSNLKTHLFNKAAFVNYL